VAAAAEQRGWAISEQKDEEYVKELAAKGMKVDKNNATLNREFEGIGARMSGEWLKAAGDDGKAVLDAYRK
jgi:TRAP-type transport system periplasmic protein